MGDLRNGEAFSVFAWVFWLVLVFFFLGEFSPPLSCFALRASLC